MAYPNYCVFEAIKHEDVVRAKRIYDNLRSRGISPRNPLLRTPLFVAVILENCELVDFFLKDPSQLEVRDEKNLTPLLWLSRQSIRVGGMETYYHIAQSLINAKANVNASDTDKRTPLFYAARNGHLNLIELLVKAGADPHVLDVGDSTLLHEASLKGNLETVEYLLNPPLSLNVNARDSFGRTPLHLAVLGTKEVVELLLKRGANLNAFDNEGYSPRYYADNLNCLDNDDMLKMLEMWSICSTFTHFDPAKSVKINHTIQSDFKTNTP